MQQQWEFTAKMTDEIWRQAHALPEAEVIEWHMQHGYTFSDCMNFKRDLKGDCIWKCWH